jgi:hypothetical protein
MRCGLRVAIRSCRQVMLLVISVVMRMCSTLLYVQNASVASVERSREMMRRISSSM